MGVLGRSGIGPRVFSVNFSIKLLIDEVSVASRARLTSVGNGSESLILTSDSAEDSMVFESGTISIASESEVVSVSSMEGVSVTVVETVLCLCFHLVHSTYLARTRDGR